MIKCIFNLVKLLTFFLTLVKENGALHFSFPNGLRNNHLITATCFYLQPWEEY